METAQIIRTAQIRSSMNRKIRELFDTLGYLEVDTPSLSPDIIPEPTIPVFATLHADPYGNSREYYLVPSPEVYMKRLIAKQVGHIYQISHCFRNSEQVGRIHNPEFSMLEWYTMDADYHDSLQVMERLLIETQVPETPDWALPPIRTLSMAEAVHRCTGIDLDKVQTTSRLREAIERTGMYLPQTSHQDTWADLFNRLFVQSVEGELPTDRPLALIDYPQQIDCLAKKDATGRYRQRWELYIGGIEIANCYTEETEASAVADYFTRAAAETAVCRVEDGGCIPDCDVDYPNMFAGDPGFPRCSGVAVGLDRLLMTRYGMEEIQGVILFPFSDRV